MIDSVSFTEEEKRHLGRIFPGNLFSKVVTVIRDAISSAPKLTDRLSQEVAVAVEAATNGLSASIGTVVDQLIRDPATLTAIAEGIAKNPSACQTLWQALEKCQKEAQTKYEGERIEALSESIVAFYKERDPEVELPAVTVERLVAQIKEQGIVYRQRWDKYPGLVAKWLEEQEKVITEVISSLVKAKTDPALVAGYARKLVLEGLTASKEIVRERLEKEEEDIGPALKKRG